MRAITADQVLYDECINAFRNIDDYFEVALKKESYSIISLGFSLDFPWEFDDFFIERSCRVNLPSAHAAFISVVKNPESVDAFHAHFFSLALASIVTFATGMPCKSTRSDYFTFENFQGVKRDLTEYDLSKLSYINPRLAAGPGNDKVNVSIEMQQFYFGSVNDIVRLLRKVKKEDYKIAMRAIRLMYLSIATKKDDFGLAYSLAIAAIEAMSQSMNYERVKDERESTWKEKGKADPDFKFLLGKYHDGARLSNLKNNFVRFIKEYGKIDFCEKLEKRSRQVRGEVPPREISIEHLDVILKDAYHNRSSFFHVGTQPPHMIPVFVSGVKESRGSEFCVNDYILGYDGVVEIAQVSIKKWLEERVEK